jgi:hypothetical protein
MPPDGELLPPGENRKCFGENRSAAMWNFGETWCLRRSLGIPGPCRQTFVEHSSQHDRQYNWAPRLGDKSF